MYRSLSLARATGTSRASLKPLIGDDVSGLAETEGFEPSIRLISV
jgi:hypothetical protein